MELKEENGEQKAVGTGVLEIIDCDLAFRSIGYQSIALPGVPFDEQRHVVPSAGGRVLSHR